MYVNPNFKTKKAFKEAVANGDPIEVYSVAFDPTWEKIPVDGWVTVEGPHYPEPHKWYAKVTIKNGSVVKVQ